MNYSQKIAKEAGVTFGEYISPDKPVIDDPLRAQVKAANALKQAVVLSYYPTLMWGFAGAISGGFLDMMTIGLLLVISSLFWLPAQAAFRECRTVLYAIGCENIFKHRLAETTWALSAFTLFIWLPIWALFVLMAKATILPPWIMIGGCASVLLSSLRYSSRVRKQYEKPKTYRWVEAWG